jgi:predicted ArsR family transcriptional regulator
LDVIFLHVPQATRKHLEALMASGNYEYQSEFAKKYIAVGRAQGLEQGLEQGRALAILGFLEARGFSVAEELRARVLATRDHAQLDTWLRRAATCTTLDEVFVE